MQTFNWTEKERKVKAQEWRNIEKVTGCVKGYPMTPEQADMQKANPLYWNDKSYRVNCATCAPAYVLRSQGFNVTAKPKIENTLNDWISRQNSFKIWQNIDGTPAKPRLYKDFLTERGVKEFTPKLLEEFYTEACKENGIYIVTIGWKDGGGHATIIQKTYEGLFYVEPQVKRNEQAAFLSLKWLIDKASPYQISTRGIMRVDNKLIDRRYLKLFNIIK